MAHPRPAAPTASTNTFERKGAQDSRDVAFDNPTERVDLARGAASGIALVDTVAGIETEPPTASVKAALEDERFMAEKVDILLHAPGSEDEHQFCEVTVNGQPFCLRRDGETVWSVPRAHVAVIAAAKTQRLVQKKITAADGSMGYEEKAVLQALYPFQVVSDPNPKGPAWLRQVVQRG